MPRTYRSFTHKEAVFRICCAQFDAVTGAIVAQRRILENYLCKHTRFAESYEPVEVSPGAPEVARGMARGAAAVGVGPMAAVAGTMAQCAAEAGLEAGADEAIVENGGDIFLVVNEPITIGLHTGTEKLADRLAFLLEPDRTPIAICSSSSTMGHSTSLGNCDLATVVAKDAALADAAATQAANLVHSVEDVDAALERIAGIDGIDGVLIVKAERVGLAGTLPQIVKTQ